MKRGRSLNGKRKKDTNPKRESIGSEFFEAPWLPAFQWQLKIAVIAGDGLKEQKSLGGNNYVELCLVDPDFCLRLSYRLSLPLEERWVSESYRA